MKRKIKLTSRIFLINKKFKVNQYYHFLKAPDVTILIPEFKGKFIVITQKREPINKITYEFPGGQIDKNESPVKSSAKELLEETGYKSISKPKKLLDRNNFKHRLELLMFNFLIWKKNKWYKGIKRNKK